MRGKTIVVVGSSNTDMIIQVERIPRAGETVLGGQFVSAAGGKGANQAVAAARAGGLVTMVARVGADVLGEQAVAGLVAAGINVEHVSRDRSAPSGVALIFVGRDGENSIAVAPGANGRLAPADAHKARAAIRNASLVLLQLETPLQTVEVAVALAVRAGTRVILNPAPARPLPAGLLSAIDLLTPNETEAERLTGVAVRDESGAARAAAKLLGRGVKQVIVTMGARGAYVAGGGLGELVPTFKTRAVDSTGAGDVFNGALAVALSEGRELRAAVRFANAAASISVGRLGAQPSAPTREEIEHLLLSANGADGTKVRRERHGRRSLTPAISMLNSR